MTPRSGWLGKCVCGGDCLSHWGAFRRVAIDRPRFLEGWWLLDYFLTALVIARLAAFQWAALNWSVEQGENQAIFRNEAPGP